MAFSTQKDFFHVPFMNESVEFECSKACVKLKSYDSAIDDRSWAHDEVQQSKFLSDLVTCQFPGGRRGHGNSEDNDDDPAGVSGSTGRAGDTNRAGGTAGAADTGRAGRIDRAGGTGRSDRSEDAGGFSDSASARDGKGIASWGDAFGSGVLSGGDSLLQCANIHLADYQNIMNIKTSLEKQLEVSNDRLKTAKEENQKIKEILASKLDSNTVKDFYNKIQKLIAAGKLSKNEENEMLQIYQKMENLYKAYEIIQAENNYLKRLIEKMASRVSMDTIKFESEQSTDVGFLQREVNKWRKECSMLREMENDYLRMKQQANKTGITEQDAANIKAIIMERNSLRDKCQSLKHLEHKVQDLEHKASEAQKVASQLSSNLNNQSNYINKVESDLQNMQKYYEEANQNACLTQECLKAQIEDLKKELIDAKSQSQRTEILQIEVGFLRNEVLKRDLALNDYDCQYKQLMDVVNELQAIKLQCLQDNHTQTCKNETDELALFTSAALEEIMKELKKKGCLNNESMAAAYGLRLKTDDTDDMYNKECCNEMYRLQKQIEDMRKGYDDALKRVKDLESETAKLLRSLDDSIKANEKLKRESEDKMKNMLAKIERLDSEINKNVQDTSKIGKELEGTLDLVNEISDVQLRNQQLANAVSAINSRDDQKIIDDLRRQLEEELAKLRKCQQDNNDLIKEAKEREKELQKLKDINKIKVEDDRQKPEEEKKKPEEEKKKPEVDKKKPGDDKKKQEDDKKKPEEVKKKLEDDKKKPEDDKKKPEDVKKKPEDDKKKSDDDKKKPEDDKKKTEDFKKKLEDDKKKSEDDKKKPQEDKKKREVEQKAPWSEVETKKEDENITKQDKPSKNDKNKKHITIKSDSSTESDTIGKDGEAKASQTVMDDDNKAKHIDEDTKASSSKKDKPKSNLDKNTTKTASHQDKSKALDEFVSKKSESFKISINTGRSFEKELRQLLDEFIEECRYCFCRLVNTKSKFHGICYKLYHCGMNSLSFLELSYLHKKLFALAEQKIPGCLLNMILEDYKEYARSLLLQEPCEVGGELDLKLLETKGIATNQKCCCCKNELCCNNSEEMIKDKVNQLEKDIEIVRNSLLKWKKTSFDTSVHFECDDSSDSHNDGSTYRAAYSPQKDKQKAMSSQHSKKLKARVKRHPDQTNIHF